ncbi:MAG: nucleotide sugar dehydrogenase, partial [Armatimonadetes bacterium]|nr:nucleotide sugar dehydrogenase [Armatimonadota bacterium]
FIISVPTPITDDKKADLRYVMDASSSIVPHLRRENLVILESTVPPGTLEETVAPILEQSGLRPGEDFHLAHCPERVIPGRVIVELMENDRVIGGINKVSAEKARELYRSFVRGNIFLTSARTAEMVKLMENVFRDVNIALANELALIAEDQGIDVWEAISLANKHPRVNIHQPGPGVGGHCIAVDPWFIVEGNPDLARLIRSSRAVNDSMPDHVVKTVASCFGEPSGKVIAVLGVAYKANVDDARESPALPIIISLKAMGFEVRIHDPLVSDFSFDLEPLESVLDQADCLILLTNHEDYRDLTPEKASGLMRGRTVIDTRGFLAADAWERAGFEARTLGRGSTRGEPAISTSPH